jgi:hypothetical protein
VSDAGINLDQSFVVAISRRANLATWFRLHHVVIEDV